MRRRVAGGIAVGIVATILATACSSNQTTTSATSAPSTTSATPATPAPSATATGSTVAPTATTATTGDTLDDPDADTSDGATDPTGTAPSTTSSAPTSGDTTPPSDGTAPPDEADDSSDTVGLTDDQRADIELARRALITLDAFPAGWTEEPTDDPDSRDDADENRIDATFERRFDECLGRAGDSVTDQLDALEASSGDFVSPDENPSSVQHSVTLAPDEETALLAMSELALEGADECLEAVVQDFFEQQLAADPDVPAELEVGDVRIDRVDTGEASDRALGYEIEIPLELGEQRGAQYLELLYHRRGRALSSLEFSSFGFPFDRDGYRALGDEAVVRIDAIAG